MVAYTAQAEVLAGATLDLGVAGRNGFGQVMYGNTIGVISILFNSDGDFTPIGSYKGFTLIQDNPATVNIYTDLSGNIIVQNNTASTLIVRNTLRGETPTEAVLPFASDSTYAGLENVDNTSDLNKPISTATQSALDLKYNSVDFNTDFDTRLGLKTTDDINEGAINLYDQTVSITGGSNVTIGGVYPNFTLTDNSASSSDLISHTTSDGTDHTFIDQDVTTAGTPTFASVQAPTIQGSSSPSGTLTLTTTSDATKGSVNIGSTAVFDELNKRLGIGTTTPETQYHQKATTSSVFLLESGENINWIRLSSGAIGSTMKYKNNKFFGIGPVATKEDVTGVSSFYMGPEGTVSLNTSLGGSQLRVRGSGNTSATYTAKFENSDGVNLLSARDDGLVSLQDTSGILQTPIIIGSSATGNNLTLYSNTSKDGLIKFGDNAFFDETAKNFVQSGSASIDGYMTTNKDNLASQVSLNPGILLYGYKAGGKYGIDLGYNNSRYRQRMFFFGNADFAFSKATTITPTTQSDFEDLVVIRGDTEHMGVGILTPTARVHAKGSGNTSATYTCKFENSDGTNLLSCRDDGLIKIDDQLDVGTLNAIGSQRAKVTDVSTTTYTVLSSDYTVSVDTTTIAAASTVTLPPLSSAWDATTGTGQVIIIKDSAGDAGTYNITIEENAADTNTIDGGTSTPVNTNYGYVTLQAMSATKWGII